MLQRLEKYNIRANKAKCKFLMDSVEYLGHVINAEGLHTTDEKVKAILQAPEPKNVQEMRSFLGLLHYYGKFLPNLAMLLNPLNDQLREGVSWRWTKDCAKAFAEAKTLLSNAPVLAHYDPSLPIKMAGDASAYGLGAVISHTFPDGSERPIAFASRTLSSAERNYPQVEKEALSLVYGIRKFHQYLYGRQFVMVTDHEPLLVLLGSKKEVPPLAAVRLQRWALLLSAYSYQLEFRKTSKHGNADFLSRLPLAGTGATSVQYTFIIAQLQALPVTAEKLVTVTRQDPCLSRVLRYAREGWPGEVEEELKPYFHRRLVLSTEGDCLLWGMRVVVPRRLRACVLQELHNDHPGVVRMKALARSICWWPQIDREIEECVRGCLDCQSVRSTPPVAPLHPWIWPSKPWQRLHVDFAGPFFDRMFFIVIDAHSKWPEVIPMTSTTAGCTIWELRKLFAAHGLPEQIVSDNGSQFTSAECANQMLTLSPLLKWGCGKVCPDL